MSLPSKSRFAPAVVTRSGVREPRPLLRALGDHGFPAELEREFREDYFSRSIVYLRWALGLAFLLNGVYGLLEISAPLPARNGLWAVRYGILWPAIAGLFLISFSPYFRRFWQLAVALALYLLGFKCVGVAAWSGFGLDHLYATLMLNLAGTYTLSRLRWGIAAFVGWGLTLTYVVVIRTGAPQHVVAPDVAYLVAANVMGMCAGYFIEDAARRDFLLRRRVQAEQETADRLLLNILPAPVAERLKRQPGTIADDFPEVTVLFADIVDFTKLSESMRAGEVVGWLNQLFSAFDDLAERHGLEKIKTIGDAYMLVGGLPVRREDHLAAVACMALAMQEEVARLNPAMRGPVALRIGIHTGPVVAGVIGKRKFSYDLWGDTVNLAYRMESHGVPGRIQVTAAVRERLQEAYAFEARDPILIKGKGEMPVCFLLGPREAIS
jgi:adenylate cyclase